MNRVGRPDWTGPTGGFFFQTETDRTTHGPDRKNLTVRSSPV